MSLKRIAADEEQAGGIEPVARVRWGSNVLFKLVGRTLHHSEEWYGYSVGENHDTLHLVFLILLQV